MKSAKSSSFGEELAAIYVSLNDNEKIDFFKGLAEYYGKDELKIIVHWKQLIFRYLAMGVSNYEKS